LKSYATFYEKINFQLAHILCKKMRKILAHLKTSALIYFCISMSGKLPKTLLSKEGEIVQ